jgi:hypothetical protein
LVLRDILLGSCEQIRCHGVVAPRR